MAHSGRFRPKNPGKYVGDHTKIIYRSWWERNYMRRLDEDHNYCLKWSSEEIIIPYRDPVDGRPRRYFVDFWLQTPKGGKFLVEVKPHRETRSPEPKARITKKYLSEVYTWGVNQAKWKAASEFCADKGWKFVILTEKHGVDKSVPAR